MRYDPVRKYEVCLGSERTGEKIDPEHGEVVACRPKRGTKRAQRAVTEVAPSVRLRRVLRQTRLLKNPGIRKLPPLNRRALRLESALARPTFCPWSVNGLGWTLPFVPPIQTAALPTRFSRLHGTKSPLVATRFTTSMFGSTTMTCRTSTVCQKTFAMTCSRTLVSIRLANSAYSNACQPLAVPINK